ncbi:hypothetical protein [Streptomyces mangrovisoli]|uniref:Uncharacterized protein n=1 Tax=Streptomyces mangrovisoli TaxID=1428628 RepID=A0A1J4NRZ8_9ACTN|nr:hypothetical protein [Streptomyces mangrovisoli]OIJ65159.1 hypothetical protein WN71_025470 [Streptomyces mangrovisoli]
MGYVERPRRIVGANGGPAGPASAPGSGRRLIGGQDQVRQPERAIAPGPRTVPHTLYRSRSRRLLDAVRTLDAGLDDQACRALAEWVREEYRSDHGDVPLGFVARCYLGPPYVDHQLNLFHVIVRHFAPAEPMPDPFSAARMLARSGGYAYIEVYGDGLILPVLEDGTVVRP